MREEQTYKVSRRPQLIDLNKDHTNFTLRFECHGDPSLPYQVCVTNQTELDTKDIADLQMKAVEGGSISGTIVADSNVYQNYFIVLRSEQDMDVVVAVDIEPMEVNSAPPSDEAPLPSSDCAGAHTASQAGTMWLRILFVALLIMFFLVIVYYIFQLNEEPVATVPLASASPSPAPPTSTPTVAPSNSLVDEIMNGL